MADEELPLSDGEMGDDQMNEYAMEEQFQQWNELFSRFKDDPELETVHCNRLLELLQAFGKNPSKGECEQRIQELEAGEKFELNFDEFLQIANEDWTSINSDRNMLRQAFNRFDDSKDGYIDIERFRTVMASLGEPLTDDEIEELIQLGLNIQERHIDIEHLINILLGETE